MVYVYRYLTVNIIYKLCLFNVVDIDECVLEIHKCDTNAVCINNIGSFDCICDQLYEGDGITCQGNLLFLSNMSSL